MPFKLFSLHKKEKKGKLKVKSKSSMDLTGNNDEPPDQSPDAVFVSPTQLQFRSKSSLHLFEPSKTSSHLSISDVKEEKAEKAGGLKKMQRMSVHVMESHASDFSKPPTLFEENETNGVRHNQQVQDKQPELSEKSDSKNHVSSDQNSKNHVANGGHFIKNHSMDQNHKSHNHLSHSHLSHNHVSNYHLHPYHYLHHHHDGHSFHGEFPSKSSSCSSFMDTNSRERRLSEIAQLDNYIDYLRRTPEDGIHTASRLCCAQVLKLSFMRLERRYVSDVLHSNSSQDRMDSFYSSSKNFSSTPPSASHFERRMTSFRRRPPYLQNLKSRHSEWTESADDEKSDGRLLDGSGDDEQTGCHVGSSEALDEKDKVRSSDYDSDSDSDGFSSRPAISKRKSIPVFPVNIEIY